MVYGYIYVVENKKNGKSYVGQTVDLETRSKAHLGGYSICPAIKNAIKKYGKENFEFVIIQSCYSLEEMNTQEIYWIDTLNTLSPNGYNLKLGGEAGGRLSQETREKISRNRKGKYLGSDNHFYGKSLSEEHKKKISLSNRGKTAGEKNSWFGKYGPAHPKYGKSPSEEWRKDMSARMSGESNPNYGKRGSETPHFGKKHSEESKKRMSEALKKAWSEGRYSKRAPRTKQEVS